MPTGPATDAEDRKSWTLTREERLEIRFDPAHIADRARAHAARLLDRDAKAPRFVIDGRTHPELFLPYELFTFFVSTVIDPNETLQSTGRSAYGPALASFEWDASTIDYIQLTRQSTGPVRPTDVSRQICRRRFEALRAMRREYEDFDRFLYVAVAPRYSLATDDPGTADWMRWVEEGCQ
jgi:hypothetical protein